MSCSHIVTQLGEILADGVAPCRAELQRCLDSAENFIVELPGAGNSCDYGTQLPRQPGRMATAYLPTRQHHHPDQLSSPPQSVLFVLSSVSTRVSGTRHNVQRRQRRIRLVGSHRAQHRPAALDPQEFHCALSIPVSGHSNCCPRPPRARSAARRKASPS